MDNILMTILGIFVAAILIFVFPLMAVTERNDNIAQTVVETATIEFVDKISISGVIKPADYEEYIQKLESTGNTFDVQMEIQHLDENFSKKNGTTSQDLIGENERYSTFTTEILENMYLSDGSLQNYKLKQGDNVIITAKNTNKTMAQTLRTFVSKVTGKGTYEIAATSSSMVVNNGGKVQLGDSGYEPEEQETEIDYNQIIQMKAVAIFKSDKRPEKVIATLFKEVNGQITIENQELNSSNNWEYTWNINKYENKKIVSYTIIGNELEDCEYLGSVSIKDTTELMYKYKQPIKEPDAQFIEPFKYYKDIYGEYKVLADCPKNGGLSAQGKTQMVLNCTFSLDLADRGKEQIFVGCTENCGWGLRVDPNGYICLHIYDSVNSQYCFYSSGIEVELSKVYNVTAIYDGNEKIVKLYITNFTDNIKYEVKSFTTQIKNMCQNENIPTLIGGNPIYRTETEGSYYIEQHTDVNTFYKAYDSDWEKYDTSNFDGKVYNVKLWYDQTFTDKQIEIITKQAKDMFEEYKSKVNRWIQNGTTIIGITGNGEEKITLQIGDYINYDCTNGGNTYFYTSPSDKNGASDQTLKTRNNLEWRVIGVENNNLIISASIPWFQLLFKENNNINEINNVAKIFDKGYGAVQNGARSINKDDIISLLNAFGINNERLNDYGNGTEIFRIYLTDKDSFDLDTNYTGAISFTKVNSKLLDLIFPTRTSDFYKTGYWIANTYSYTTDNWYNYGIYGTWLDESGEAIIYAYHLFKNEYHWPNGRALNVRPVVKLNGIIELEYIDEYNNSKRWNIK